MNKVLYSSVFSSRFYVCVKLHNPSLWLCKVLLSWYFVRQKGILSLNPTRTLPFVDDTPNSFSFARRYSGHRTSDPGRPSHTYTHIRTYIIRNFLVTAWIYRTLLRLSPVFTLFPLFTLICFSRHLRSFYLSGFPPYSWNFVFLCLSTD